MSGQILTRPSPTRVPSRRCRPSGNPQQVELFADVPPMSVMQTPVWQELPMDIRTSLTGLLTRLLRDHTQASSDVSSTEINHNL